MFKPLPWTTPTSNALAQQNLDKARQTVDGAAARIPGARSGHVSQFAIADVLKHEVKGAWNGLEVGGVE